MCEKAQRLLRSRQLLLRTIAQARGGRRRCCRQVRHRRWHQRRVGLLQFVVRVCWRRRRCAAALHHHPARRASGRDVRRRMDAARFRPERPLLPVRFEHAAVAARANELARLRRRHAAHRQGSVAVVERGQRARSLQSPGDCVLLLAGVSQHSDRRSHSRGHGPQR